MRIKATIVAYAFLVRCFENATIVAYAGLRVKLFELLFCLMSLQCYNSIRTAFQLAFVLITGYIYSSNFIHKSHFCGQASVDPFPIPPHIYKNFDCQKPA